MPDKRREWKPVDGSITADRRPAPCFGCGVTYTPRVAETICPECVSSIVHDPDTWMRRLE